MSIVQTYVFCVIAIILDVVAAFALTVDLNGETAGKTVSFFADIFAIICGFVGVIGMTYYM